MRKVGEKKVNGRKASMRRRIGEVGRGGRSLPSYSLPKSNPGESDDEYNGSNNMENRNAWR